MSNEPEYEQPAHYSAATPSSSISVHVPLAILGFAIALFLFTQVRALSAQSRILRWQITNADKQQTALTDGEKQLKDAWAQREPAVKQSVEIQTKFQKLFSDLLALAQDGDKDAQKIVEDWKIQKPAPPAATPEPAK